MIYYKAEMDVTRCKEIQKMRAKDSIWEWVKYGQEKVIVGYIYIYIEKEHRLRSSVIRY